MIKKYLISLIVIVLAGLVGMAIYGYFQTTTLVTINYQDVNSISIVDQSQKVIKKLSSSGEHIRLAKAQTFSVVYTAQDGFKDGRQTFSSSDTNVTVKPYYSDSRLANLYTEEAAAITTALNDAYPAAPVLYVIDHQKLYHYGDWFGAKLTYKGKDIFNDDTLKVIAHKENNTWVIVTNPPMPSLNSYNTANGDGAKDGDDDHHHSPASHITVPIDILRAVNNL